MQQHRRANVSLQQHVVLHAVLVLLLRVPVSTVVPVVMTLSSTTPSPLACSRMCFEGIAELTHLQPSAALLLCLRLVKCTRSSFAASGSSNSNQGPILFLSLPLLPLLLLSGLWKLWSALLWVTQAASCPLQETPHITWPWVGILQACIRLWLHVLCCSHHGPPQG